MHIIIDSVMMMTKMTTSKAVVLLTDLSLINTTQVVLYIHSPISNNVAEIQHARYVQVLVTSKVYNNNDNNNKSFFRVVLISY